MATITIEGTAFATYGTVAEADAYFLGRAGREPWDQLAQGFQELDKEQALIRATDLFDELPWVGRVTDVAQDLSWPRTSGVINDPGRGYSYAVDDTNYVSGDPAVPTRLKSAYFELAYHILNNPNFLTSTGSVEDLRVSGISLTEITEAPVIPAFIRRMIRPMLVQGRSGNAVFVGG